MIEITKEVGEHHVNGKQCSVPQEILDEIGAEPGDTLEFAAIEKGAIITKPLPEDEQ